MKYLLTFQKRRMGVSKVTPSLADWIQRRLDTYKEKPRKGTPRGQRYGIPKHKYHAALLHLAYTRAFSLRDIAKEAGVSYKLLSKWRTEDRFIDLVSQAISKYSQLWVVWCLHQIEEHEDWDNVAALIRQELPNYSLFLVRQIMKDLSARAELDPEEMKSFKIDDEKSWKRLEKAQIVYGLLHAIWAVGVETWGNKEEKIRLHESRAQIESDIIELSARVFALYLKNDMKNEAQKVFNNVSCAARDAITEASNLRKALVERGLDTTIAGAIKKAGS